MKTILDLLHEDGIQPRRVGAKHGGEYHSPCPGCGGRDRFVCWPEASGGMGGGLYWCRGGASDGNGCACQGDAVQYLRDFRGMSFAEAREYFGLRDEQSQRRSQPAAVRPAAPVWAPVEAAVPPELWRQKGAAFVSHCEQELTRQPQVLEWLRLRGLPEEAARRRRLGFHVVAKGQVAYRPLSSWGMSGPRQKNGREGCFTLLPGLVIPFFSPEGELHKLKIREFEGSPWPEWAHGDKYREVRGSNQRYSVYGQGRDLAALVETELDAVLLAERVGDLAACVATGSAQRRPDAWAAEVLRGARLVLNALDSDDAGAKAAWTWWAQNFPNARRWPVPRSLGKDPGDLARAGVDVRLWIEAGVRRYAPALLATAAPHPVPPVQSPAVAKPAPGPVRAAARSWPVPEGAALADVALPAQAPGLDELLRTLQARPLSDPGCLVPCPRTRPPFWWSYFKDCAGCAGHPQCLLDLVRSEAFQEAVAAVCVPATAQAGKEVMENR